MYQLPSAREALRPFLGIGSRAAGATLRPFPSVAAIAVDAGVGLGHRAVEFMLDSPEFQSMVNVALDSERLKTALTKALDSDAAKELVAIVFESSLFEEAILRLLDSEQLWLLVDEIANSPAVTAAIAGQSLGFADQVGDEVRKRSRNADDWLERLAHRLKRRRAAVVETQALSPGTEA